MLALLLQRAQVIKLMLQRRLLGLQPLNILLQSLAAQAPFFIEHSGQTPELVGSSATSDTSPDVGTSQAS